MSPSLGTFADQLADPQVYGAFGIHPHSAKFYNDALEQRIVAAMQHPKAVAWGECGLDVRTHLCDTHTHLHTRTHSTHARDTHTHITHKYIIHMQYVRSRS